MAHRQPQPSLQNRDTDGGSNALDTQPSSSSSSSVGAVVFSFLHEARVVVVLLDIPVLAGPVVRKTISPDNPALHANPSTQRT